MTRSLVVSRVFLWSVLLLLPISVSAQQLEIHYINVNWGGSVLVKGPNGTTVLRCFSRPAISVKAQVGYCRIFSRSESCRPTVSTTLFAGHQHCDHIGGLDEVIQAGYNVHIKLLQRVINNINLRHWLEHGGGYNDGWRAGGGSGGHRDLTRKRRQTHSGRTHQPKFLSLFLCWPLGFTLVGLLVWLEEYVGLAFV